jgi:uncharacterized protein involved in exopolysaccharide biosynthesis
MEDRFEDEIELIDYLRVMWKWKWLIVVGTLFCALGASIYSFTRPVIKMHKVSALVEVDPGAKLDPLDKIKSMIEYGLFDKRVLDDLSSLQEIPKLDHLSFEVALPKGLNLLDIAYRTPNPGLGKAVLNSLIKQLEQEYASQSDRMLDEISMHIARFEARKEQARLIEVTIDQTKKALQEAQSNSDQLSAKRKATLLNPDDRAGHATIFMDAAAINQVIDYPLTLRERIGNLISQKSLIAEKIMSEIDIIKDMASGVTSLGTEEDANVGDHEDFILKLKSKIDSFKRGGSQLTGIIVRQPPTASPIPIKKKATLHVMLAGVGGFFVMLFLAFLVEYVQGYRGKLGS